MADTVDPVSPSPHGEGAEGGQPHSVENQDHGVHLPAGEARRAATDDPPTAGSIDSKNIPWPRLARADDSLERDTPTAIKTPGNPYQILTMVGMQVCAFGLLLGGYFLGQAWAPAARRDSVANRVANPGEPAYKAQRSGGERALEAANRALKAERARDFLAARTIYDDMVGRQAPLPRAEYRLALLALHQGDYLQTETHLNRSIRAGDAVADCYFFRASLAGMKSNYADASIQLAAAVRVEPFNAKFCFCWGESLRREGRFPEAMIRLTQALDRPDNSAARALYLFKLRLAKVEAGTDPVFDAELAIHVSESAPGGDWLLLAAAQELGRRNFVAAVEPLQKAKTVLSPDIFGNYVQDYLFQTQRARSELAAVLNVTPPDANPPVDAPLQDPATWTAAEADPAAWPPFPTAE